MKEELKEFIIAVILVILIIPIIIADTKATERAIKYCLDQGYSEHYCTDIKR